MSSTKPRTTRSRRLRKKLYLDEFAVYGFEFSCDLGCENEESLDNFMDELIDFIEAQHLCLGGGGDEKSFSAFVCSDERYGSATQENIQNTHDWLTKHQLVSNVKMGDLVDANHC
ncbi:YggL family protein [Thalassotalea marina]|uniref:DUF469 family protein n=1 Tax=Thalassotalea marina TaxID=1673741 RepID=A0A919BK28_9GAMM|nr:YggL family protein [Thalassotalea marina]GHF97390.1 hypothetical protein GCM10017161_26950 [Thalassotalea marina]